MWDNLTLEKDALFAAGDSERIWKKYCGFLDLSVDEFMTIQGMLLKEQLDLLVNSELGKKLMGGQRWGSIEEFRKNVPLTTYEDYQPYLDEKREEAFPGKPVIWAHTSGRTGTFKWVPYTAQMLNRLADDTISAFILSSANRKGEMLVHEGVRVVLNLPPVPYITGIMGAIANRRVPYEAIPPLEDADKMQFEQRIKEGYKIALHTGIDYAASIAVVLEKVGETFGQLGGKTKFSLPTWHPLAVLRMLKAVTGSKLRRRPLLPRDLWKIKGLVCGGTDTSIYRDSINYYWGVQPLDIYVATETAFIAMQGWNKKGLTFVPYTNFYEFIPEEEWLKSRADRGYKPATVLMDELQEGKIYEIVITGFHGSTFVRYRIGDLVKIISLRDAETGVNLPQMVFQSRADDVIDIAGFARLDEKIIWQAIQRLGIPYVDWSARKEYRQEKPVLNIYLELAQNRMYRQDELERLIDQQLTSVSNDYKDFRDMTGTETVKVTLLEKGAFQNYQNKKRAQGFDLAHLKPPHVNAPDAIIQDLLSGGLDS